MIQGSLLTVIVGTALTVAPQILPAIPKPYDTLASAVLGALVTGWHLYQTPPSQQK